MTTKETVLEKPTELHSKFQKQHSRGSAEDNLKKSAAL
jgi:hypothetical protein